MEDAVNAAVIKATRLLGDVQRVENLCVPGMPDINGVIQSVEWWVESKWLPCWPRNCPVVKMDKIRPAQRIWWRRRGMCGGRVFILVGVDVPKLWLLYDWHTAAGLGTYTVQQMLDLALVRGGPRFPEDAVVHALVHGRCGPALAPIRQA